MGHASLPRVSTSKKNPKKQKTKQKTKKQNPEDKIF